MGTTVYTTSDSNSTQTGFDVSNLPAEVAGWTDLEPEDPQTVIEYWKKGSNHVNGEYERLKIRRISDGDIRLIKSSFDQFDHLLTSRTITTKDREDLDWIWDFARNKMEKYPASDQFDSKPGLPEQVGEWELIDLPPSKTLDKTQWELGWGKAELTIEETEFESFYSHTKRLEEVTYSEPAFEINVATDVPRTMAFEIALRTLETVQQPLSEVQDVQNRLQEIKGIGPKKAQQLILLGFTTPSELGTFIKHGSKINHHHGDAVDKLLTKTIREELGTL